VTFFKKITGSIGVLIVMTKITKLSLLKVILKIIIILFNFYIKKTI